MRLVCFVCTRSAFVYRGLDVCRYIVLLRGACTFLLRPLLSLNRRHSPASNTDCICVWGLRRELFCSDIYRYDHPNLVLVLASALHKMAASPITPVKDLDKERPYIFMTDHSWSWAKLTFDPSKLQLHTGSLPQISAKKFYFLRDWGAGGDGHCWAACTTSGKVMALKISRKDSKEERKASLDREAAEWEKCNPGLDARVIPLNDDWALMTPYLHPLSEDDKQQPAVTAQLKQVIQRYAQKGSKHKDLHGDPWRHVGFASPLKKGGPLRVALLDFGQVDIDVDPDTAARDMLAAFKI